MSLLGFDAIGRLALGAMPERSTTIVLRADSGAFAFTGLASAFAWTAAVQPGAVEFTGNAIAYSVSTAVSAGAFAFTVQASQFKLSLRSIEGPFEFTGFPVSDHMPRPVEAGKFAFSGGSVSFFRDFVNWLPSPQPQPPEWGEAGDASGIWTPSGGPSNAWAASGNASGVWSPSEKPSDIWTPNPNQQIPATIGTRKWH